MQKGEELFRRGDINQLHFSNSFVRGKITQKEAFSIFILHYILTSGSEKFGMFSNNYENILCATYHIIHHIIYLCDFTK